MKTLLTNAIFFACLMITSCSAPITTQIDFDETVPETANTSGRTPVLIELFTSEGCSSCPPADRALTFLHEKQPVAEADVIALSFHVDYWNYLGWRDEFSSSEFSQRQEEYARQFKLSSNYTPQMVVDGTAEFVGSNQDKATNAIKKAVSEKKGKAALTLAEGKIKITLSDLPKTEGSTIFLAIAEDDLSSNVTRGENSGSILRHSAIVRELRDLGPYDPKSSDYSSDIRLQSKWSEKNVRLVVFVQEHATRKIIAVNHIRFRK
ncbi:MAG: DUF1223 domain-containing protein [Blastocatellia bacterium]